MQLRLPVLPVYRSSVTPPVQTDGPVLPNARDLKHKTFLDSGSTAIALALRLSVVGEGDEVLIPAYHCPTMATPATALGAKVVFYKIREDLSCNLPSIRESISARTRALLVSHFFGVAHDLSEIRGICDDAGIRLIEDCAHMYFGNVGNKPVGSTGDYAVFSTRKFFPGADGGILASGRHEVSHSDISKPGLLRELKAVLDVGEESLRYDEIGRWRLPMLAVLGTKAIANRMTGRATALPNPDLAATETDAGGHSLPLRAMSRISRRLLGQSNDAALIEGRRRNFSLLNKTLTKSGAFRTITGIQSQVQVPYMYPLIVDDPGIYTSLRAHGWPIWRWDDSSRSCSVSEYYAEHLLQVPCHQSLGTNAIEMLGQAILDCGDNLAHG